MKTLYLIWRQPERRWWPVGRLRREGTDYVFEYTRGALAAQSAGFRPLLSFPDLDTAYLSADLFPLFANRLPPTSRGDYQDFVEALDLSGEQDPLVLLARSGGERQTDTFEVFPAPERTPEGRLETTFFVRGLKYKPADTHDEVLRLHPGDPLVLEADPDNPHDSLAVRVLSDRRTHLGHVPRYLAPDVQKLREAGVHVSARVRRVNPPPTPMQFRVLCDLSAEWPPNFSPLRAQEFEPLHALVPQA
jgi:HIRAN domain